MRDKSPAADQRPSVTGMRRKTFIDENQDRTLASGEFMLRTLNGYADKFFSQIREIRNAMRREALIATGNFHVSEEPAMPAMPIVVPRAKRLSDMSQHRIDAYVLRSNEKNQKH